ncbi:TIGR01906 family membrane protein [Lacticaseibacillus thailandensis]|uniref:Membrane protein n=1 Tax=Lacticaseibacillus thailandensis DSM 22698 = JCM 13996 TaxID=1423810 RepID=A0A0R2CJZ5_9LACO|nr:TIGR01906 family membrane protein [Lacticaseibacillus thailandensis]KRM88422.1 membrane protein [Lacticaseibacillus thailandensis DSM 22698 = JCM 13996]
MLSRGRRWGRLLLLWLALISTIIVVVTLCSIPLFVGWIRWDHLDRVAGVSPARLLHNYLNMWSYLYMPWVHRLWLPDFRVSVNGATHFADVQHLFVLNLIVMVVSLPLSWRWLQQLRRNQQGYVLRTSAWGGLAVIMALLVAMGINFNGFFVIFHEVLFRNQDWEFDPALDPIINVLPEGFFAACFVLGFGLLIVALVVILRWGRRDARRHQ